MKAWLEEEHDFPDALSPIVVKELRQALRTKWFVIAFLLLQLFFVGILILATMNYTKNPGDFDITEFDYFFWFLLGANMILVTPLRALNALSSEKKANTLELMQLSNLGSWRIVLGKWVSIWLQLVLVVISVIPYGIVRYFLGGANLIEDLAVVIYMMFGALLLSAGSIALSNFPTWIKGVGVVGVLMMSTSISGFAYAIGRSSVTGWGDFSVTVLVAIWDWVLMTVFGLLVGCGTIAASAENFTKWKRVIVLGFWLPVGGLLAFEVFEELAITQAVIGLLVWGYVVMEGMTKEEDAMFAHVRFFARFKVMGRIVGRFFYPTWPSCVLFVLLSAGLIICMSMVVEGGGLDLSDVAQGLALVFYLISALLLPKTLMLLINWRPSYPIFWHIGFHISGVFLFLFIEALNAFAFEERIHYGLMLMPISAVMSLMGNKDDAFVYTFLFGGSAFLAVLIFILMHKARRYMKRLREHEKRAYGKEDVEEVVL